jgi:glycosyltransferase involved in cell wall biosynthesis
VTAIAAVGVGVPAHDEADVIEAGLRSIVRAAGRARVPTHVVVVADACGDDTAERARRALAHARGVDGHVVEAQLRSAGAARQVALDLALERTGVAPEAAWLASTDADTLVDVSWVQTHLRWAATGVDGIAGLVELDLTTIDADLAERYRRSLAPVGTSAGHPHVHGANLGVRGSCWRQVGGCGVEVVGEDHELWRRLRAAGSRLAGVDDLRVRTSGRLVGRAPDGFSGYLRRLAADTAQPA